MFSEPKINSHIDKFLCASKCQRHFRKCSLYAEMRSLPSISVVKRTIFKTGDFKCKI